MNLSDRNSRLILVITFISTLIFLLKKGFPIVKSSFSYIYTGDTIPIGLEHIFSIALISNLIIVFTLALIYCYFEAQTYGGYPEDVLKGYEKKADNYYQKLISSFKTAFFITIILFFIMLEIPIINKSILVKLTCIIILIISLSYIKWKWEKLNRLFSSINRFIAPRINLFTILHWILAFSFFFAILSILAIKSNLDTQVVVDFSDEKEEMKITYNDKTTDMLPVMIFYKVNGIKININDSDALVAGSKKESSENRRILFNNNSINKEFLTGSNVTYTYVIDLKSRLHAGKNNIEIHFEINDLISDFKGKQKYTIWNSIVKNGDNLVITKKKFTFNID